MINSVSVTGARVQRDSSCVTAPDAYASSSDTYSTTEPKITTDNRFMYLNVNAGCLPITALLDSGIEINVISKQLYDSLPQSVDSNFSLSEMKVVVASNTTVKDSWYYQYSAKSWCSQKAVQCVCIYFR